jgi:hypothetical protein
MERLCGTTPVEVKDILASNTNWLVENPKLTGENREKTGTKT